MRSIGNKTMDWSNDLTLLLVELYRSKPCLWDPKDNNYRIKSVKNDAWREISEVLKCSLDEAKRKMESVLASFRRERQRQLKAGADGGYNSSWFAFNHMQFLMDKFHTRTVDIDDSQVLEDDNEIENASIADEKPDLNIVIDEPLSASVVSKEREKWSDSDIPQQALPQKKRYLQSARVGVSPYRTLHDSASRRIPRDENAVFGEYIAMKLRRYSDYTKNVVQHLISNVIFEADMGKYNETSHSEDNIFSPYVITQVSPPNSSL